MLSGYRRFSTSEQPHGAKITLTPIKAAPVDDALDRGRVPLDGAWLEVGSGTGRWRSRSGTPRVTRLVCTDLSEQMLLHAPRPCARRVRADASALPFADYHFNAILVINMLLFPSEIDRLLRSDGVLVWVNTLGDQTPIHLPPADVLGALPGQWSGITARPSRNRFLVDCPPPASDHSTW